MGYWKNTWASPNDSSRFAWGKEYSTQTACITDMASKGNDTFGGRTCQYIETTPPQPPTTDITEITGTATTTPKKTDDILKYIIIGAIILILLRS